MVDHFRGLLRHGEIFLVPQCKTLQMQHMHTSIQLPVQLVAEGMVKTLTSSCKCELGLTGRPFQYKEPHMSFLQSHLEGWTLIVCYGLWHLTIFLANYTR